MSRGFTITSIFLLAILATPVVPSATGAEPEGQNGSERWTVWDGLYTNAEADNGWYAYDATCSRCHGEGLEGGSAPALTGDHFLESWREDTLESLFGVIQNMPPRGPSLNERYALDVLGYILQVNRYPAGGYRLSSDTLETVWIEGANGRQPVPDRSLIEVVGCMTEAGSDWILTMASEPVRTRNSDRATQKELDEATTKPLGVSQFRLQNFYMLGSFEPDQHQGHKMQAKGALIRNSDGDRISLTALGMVAEGCEP
jgi:cytochrome c5